jgi:3-oxoacyl-[acyl-carrier-protein] synthase-3
MALKAVEQALSNANKTAQDLDLIVVATLTPDNTTPSVAARIAGRLGVKPGTPAFDLGAACSGFVYSMTMVDNMIRLGQIKTAAIVGVESLSKIVDWTDRNTCVLFGDGAGAVVVSHGEGMICSRLTTESKTDCLYYLRKLEPTPYITKEEYGAPMYMNGKEVFKTAVLSSSRDIKRLLDKAGMHPTDIKYYVLHQANMRIIEAIANWLKLDLDHFPTNVERCGNTSSASIPLLLDELARSGKLQKGDKILMSAFGAGFTTGACIIEWTK